MHTVAFGILCMDACMHVWLSVSFIMNLIKLTTSKDDYYHIVVLSYCYCVLVIVFDLACGGVCSHMFYIFFILQM